MKLWGFTTLKLGPIEVKLVFPGGHLQSNVPVCSWCDSCCPRMFLANCGHVLCERCLLELPDAEEDSSALCIICRRTTTVMEVPIQEQFVIRLRCTCPLCDLELTVGELRDHSTNCILTKGSVPERTAGTPTVVTDGTSTTQRPPSRAHESSTYLDTTSTSASSAAARYESLQSIVDNRLNLIEQRLQSHCISATYPSCHTLLFRACTIDNDTKLYRTLTVYLEGVGFYCTAYDERDYVNLWFSLASHKGHQVQEAKLAWRIKIQQGDRVQTGGTTSMVRNPHAGQCVYFESVFKDNERAQAIITVLIDRE